MYFVVAYDWKNNQLTDKWSIGFFRTLSRAKKFSSNLPILTQNTVAIIKASVGVKCYTKTVEVYSWSHEYHSWIPVRAADDIRRNIEVGY